MNDRHVPPPAYRPERRTIQLWTSPGRSVPARASRSKTSMARWPKRSSGPTIVFFAFQRHFAPGLLVGINK